MKKNGFAPIIIILVIAILGVFGYFAYKNYLVKPQTLTISSPSPSTTLISTANWKTYQFADFSIKLPIEFYNAYSSENTIQFLNYKSSTIGSDFDPQKDKGKLKIEVYLKDGSSLDDYENQEKQKAIELHGAGVDTSYNPIMIDGQTAKQFSSWVDVKNPSKNEIISINFLLDFNNYTDLSSQILSTFKFIK